MIKKLPQKYESVTETYDACLIDPNYPSFDELEEVFESKPLDRASICDSNLLTLDQ